MPFAVSAERLNLLGAVLPANLTLNHGFQGSSPCRNSPETLRDGREMNDRQTALDWLSVHLRGIGAAIVASWDAAVSRAAPALKTARDWVAVHLQATADWVGATIHAGSDALRPYLSTVFAAVAPHWPQIVMAAAAVIGGIAVWALRSLRRHRKLKASLVEATLGHDPKTDWLELGIVVRNLQPRALLVRSIQVIDPPGTKICDRWQAWQPTTVGVKFVAPELELTNSISIERTVLPYGSVNYAAFGGSFPQRPTQENARVPYESKAPAHATSWSGVSMCCLQTQHRTNESRCEPG